MTERFDLDGEVLAEEDAEGAGQPTRALDAYREPPVPVLRTEVRTAALAAAGGAIAGVATVAAVRAVGSRGRSPRRPSRRRAERPNVLASRSFLVDVHLLDR